MLIEFSVENFRSIAERQTFSMASGIGAARLPQYSMPSGNSFAPQVLRSACMLGPNGSGKTSIARGMSFYSRFVANSAKDHTEGETINVTPFKLDRALACKPSEFEAIFVHEGALYQYGFSVDESRVHGEWLFSRPNTSGTRMRMLFQREYIREEDRYQWAISDAHVKGERETWKSSTRANALFLSTAILLQSESLKPVYDWIRYYLRVILQPDQLTHHVSARRLLKEDKDKQKLLDFLSSHDLSIHDIEVDEEDFVMSDEVAAMFQSETLDLFRNQNLKTYNVHTFHKAKDGSSVEFDLDEESTGTRALFSLSGPWLDVLEHGYTLVVDELHNSLHPMALRNLVRMINDPELNKNGAQLVFTSHDTSVLAKGLMHKDQIWLLERNEDQSTNLFPLSDFKVRDLDTFQRSYLDGKFGALPKIRDLLHVQE